MRTILFFLALTSVVAGCGGGDSIAINDLTTKFIAAQCAERVACQSMPDTATCEAALIINDSASETLIAAVKAGTIKYDGDAAGKCADELASQSCSFTGFYTANDPCAKMFTGTVATGGACFITEECAGNVAGTAQCTQTDSNCDSSTTCCPGTCTGATPKVALGGSCASANCADNLYCASDSTCKMPVAGAGAACDDILGCANPMYCNGDPQQQTFSGTCKAPPATGAACNLTDLLPCADGRDYCDTGTKVCTRNAAVGAACDSDGTGNGAGCVGYADCDTTNLCVARLKAGASCSDTTGPACLGSLSCTNSSCALPPAGMTCM